MLEKFQLHLFPKAHFMRSQIELYEILLFYQNLLQNAPNICNKLNHIAIFEPAYQFRLLQTLVFLYKKPVNIFILTS